MDKQVLTLEIATKYPFTKIIQYDLETGKKVSDYENIVNLIEVRTLYWGGGITDENIGEGLKLQLRKLSSLTDEEKQFLKDGFMLRGFDTDSDYSFESLISWCVSAKVKDFIDWCRKNRFDIDGLIESGVAEEVR